jgi:hypothetical protein
MTGQVFARSVSTASAAVAPPFWLSGRSIESRGRIRLLAVVLVGVTFLQRFAVPGTSEIVGVGFALGFAMTVLGLGLAVLCIDPKRLVLYALAMSGLLLTMLIKSNPYSVSSFAMLAVLYLPFIAMFTVSVDEYRRGLNMLQQIMALLAIAGLLQLAVQVVGGPDWAFPLDGILPEQAFISKYNLRIPISDLPYLKSTGFVFLEPSLFSQFLAFSILIELLYFRRLARLALLGSAYLTTFSGTGAVLLLAVSVPLIIRRRQYGLLLPIAFAIVLSPWLQDVPPFSVFFGRLDEFSAPQSSGSMRFFGPYHAINDLLLGHPTALLFGYGPGTSDTMSWLLDYEVLNPSWLKLLLEYGMIGAVSFMPLYLYVLFAQSPDRLLSFACLVQFLLLGGYLNSFYVQFFCLVLVGWPRVAAPALTPLQPNGSTDGPRPLRLEPEGA